MLEKTEDESLNTVLRTENEETERQTDKEMENEEDSQVKQTRKEKRQRERLKKRNREKEKETKSIKDRIDPKKGKNDVSIVFAHKLIKVLCSLHAYEVIE
jgi:hypothetical protein